VSHPGAGAGAGSSLRRVALTGYGIVSCLGCDPATVGGNLRQGVTGIVVDERRVALGFRSPLTGRVSGFSKPAELTRKDLKTMPEFAVWAYAAARDAASMAGLAPADLHDPGTGLIVGSDSTALAAVEQVDLLRSTGKTTSIGSGAIFRSMNSTVTMNLNILLGTKGACWTLSAACASGAHAVGQAADLVALGRQRRVLCGGAQEINPESICSFDGLGAFSVRTDDPGKASRPFDRERDGLVPGGGAAMLVLEEMEQARARGATILGEVLGYAFSSDGAHLSLPSGEGLVRSMREAIGRAGLAPGDIDYLCAHATSTPAGDAAEAGAIREVFGRTTPPVSSLKGMTGHELWMSGASQVVYTTIMANMGFIAPNANFTSPDEGSAGLDIVTRALPRPPRRALLNAAGFGGTNSSLVVGFGP
jgi:3-oxoacyl-[acyl-carrier-protein] synthase-1